MNWSIVWTWDSKWIVQYSMGNHGAAGVSSERRRSSCSSQDWCVGVCCHNALGLVRTVWQIPRPNDLGILLPVRTRPRAFDNKPLQNRSQPLKQTSHLYILQAVKRTCMPSDACLVSYRVITCHRWISMCTPHVHILSARLFCAGTAYN